MKLLYVVQRYGAQIAGGAEAACRSIAEHMAARGHHIEVLTSRAHSYNDWADAEPAGTSLLNGVVVHRLSVRAPRSEKLFAPLHRRAFERAHAALPLQRDWLRVHGPDLPELTRFLADRAHEFDAVVFYTYLFAPTALGAPAAAARTAVVVHPAAHDEPAFYLDVFEPALRCADGISCQTVEELELVRRRVGGHVPAAVVGLGVDVSALGDGARFRRDLGLGDRPYVVYLGRLAPGKGTDELHRFMTAIFDRGTVDTDLVVVGEPLIELGRHPRVHLTGFVDEQTKLDALAGANVLAMPSYFESFSLALCEGWVQGRAALVQGWCDVLAGQARRSRGALAYRSFGEFEAQLKRLIGDPDLCRTMGENGRRYVLDNYQWHDFLERYEAFLEAARERFEARQRPSWFATSVGAPE